MGQLEKYGLYVLCLLIFLILGVTLWGSGNMDKSNGGNPPVRHLNAGGDGVNPADSRAADSRAADGRGATNRSADSRRPVAGVPRQGGDAAGGGATRLPNFRELLTPGTRPAPVTNAIVGNRSSGGAANGSAANGGAAANASLGAGNQRQPVSAPPQPQPEPVPVANRPTYKIQRGDTYESIARERFQTRSMVSEIARLNPRLDPLKLRPGLEILMPTKAEAETFLAGRAAKRAGVQLGNTYKIKKGDTLIGIAKRELGSDRRLPEIQSLNPGVDPMNLRVGASLRMPKK